MRRNITVMSLALLSSSVLAHSGHDHSHWSSSPLHLLSAAAIVCVLIVAVVVYKKRAKLKREVIGQ